ncbi:histone deacetylase family protein [Natronorarus salvus]|uniref:histone deacetylase family protein n=1 Tax=Natronorarus salvus TaxID=3117733 RepID=UPI002F26834C
MRFGYTETCLEHDTGTRHPETADRLRAIRRGLARKYGVEYVDAEPASVEVVEAVHDPGYVEAVREFCAEGGGNWDPDTVAVEATWDAALASAGLAQWAAETAVAGADGRQTPFSIGRPPGHHALSDDAMGFCFFNNAAVAAQATLDAGATESVAILDWDVHHGNGTQEIFEERGDVLYLSIHEQGLYPGTGEAEEVGEGEGEGTTMNVPLAAGADDDDYGYVFERVILPALTGFDPDLLIVSAGFDAHRHDPISRMRVSTDGYGRFTLSLQELAEETDTPLAFVLEGGYGLDTLSEGVAMVHEVFDGHVPLEIDGEPTDTTRDLVDELGERHGLGS